MAARGLSPGDLVHRIMPDRSRVNLGSVIKLCGRGRNRLAFVRWDSPVLGEQETWTNIRQLDAAVSL